jgi:hypothetical protein
VSYTSVDFALQITDILQGTDEWFGASNALMLYWGDMFQLEKESAFSLQRYPLLVL